MAFYPVYDQLLSLIRSLKGLLAIALMGVIFLYSKNPCSDIGTGRSWIKPSNPLSDLFQLPEIIIGVFIYFVLVSLALWPWIHIRFKRGVLKKITVIFLGIFSQIVFVSLTWFLKPSYNIPHIGGWKEVCDPIYEYFFNASVLLFWFILIEVFISSFYFLPTLLFSSSKKIRYISRTMTIIVTGLAFVFLTLLFSWLFVIYAMVSMILLGSWLHLLFTKESKSKMRSVFLGVFLQVIVISILVQFILTFPSIYSEKFGYLLYASIILISGTVLQVLFLILRSLYPGIKDKEKELKKRILKGLGIAGDTKNETNE